MTFNMFKKIFVNYQFNKLKENLFCDWFLKSKIKIKTDKDLTIKLMKGLVAIVGNSSTQETEPSEENLNKLELLLYKCKNLNITEKNFLDLIIEDKKGSSFLFYYLINKLENREDVLFYLEKVFNFYHETSFSYSEKAKDIKLNIAQKISNGIVFNEKEKDCWALLQIKSIITENSHWCDLISMFKKVNPELLIENFNLLELKNKYEFNYLNDLYFASNDVYKKQQKDFLSFLDVENVNILDCLFLMYERQIYKKYAFYENKERDCCGYGESEERQNEMKSFLNCYFYNLDNEKISNKLFCTLCYLNDLLSRKKLTTETMFNEFNKIITNIKKEDLIGKETIIYNALSDNIIGNNFFNEKNKVILTEIVNKLNCSNIKFNEQYYLERFNNFIVKEFVAKGLDSAVVPNKNKNIKI